MPAIERCGSCGAETSTDGSCPACMLDRGLIEGESSRAGSLALKSLGDYELLDEIARGGMGVVYKARQKSLNRIVAIKMVLAGRLAKESDLQRFKAEAETAARLQHPNIVAIHEVGEVEGQPFFSMDYVDGQSLAELARNEPLPAKRAAVYLKIIAEAVEYAHSKGVLHRDLKPSNILIDQNDQPRITDFGLAKRLDDYQQSTLNKQLTATGQVLGSPNFMPPEQASGNRKEVGPASDVYSLGAILYQLSTGRPPFAAESLTQTLRLVAESEPVSPRLLNPSLPRDLETICLKSLQKEPLKRYGSAHLLADDVSRFLRNEPILARPVGGAERAWRWCRRNPKLAVSVATALTLLLVVAIGSPLAAIRINHARQKAEREAAKSKQVSGFLKDMLNGVGPSVALGRDPTMLREILDKTAEGLRRELKDQPEVEADLRNTVGEVYWLLGEFVKAEAMHREALILRRKQPGFESLDVAASLDNLALSLWRQGKLTAAEATQRESLTMRRKLQGNEHPDLSNPVTALAQILNDEGNLAEAETNQRTVLELRRKLGADPKDVADSLKALASVLYREKKLTEAEDADRQALALQEKLLAPEDPELAMTLNDLGTVLQLQGRFAEAEDLFHRAVEVGGKTLAKDHPAMLSLLANLANALGDQGHYVEAEKRQRDLLDLRKKQLTEEHPKVADSLSNLAKVLQAQDKLVDAEKSELAALAMRRKLLGAENIDVAVSLSRLGSILKSQGRLEEAEKALGDALAMRRKLLGNEHRDVAWSLHDLADVLLDRGRLPEAEKLAHESLAIQEKILPDDWRTPLTASLLGAIFMAQKRSDEAQPLLLSGYAGLKQRRAKIPAPFQWRVKAAAGRLVQFYEATGQPDKVFEWKKELEDSSRPSGIDSPLPVSR